MDNSQFTLKPPPQYQSYLLRCVEVRRSDPEAPRTWRFSLKDPIMGEQRHFADLDALLVFLQSTFESSETSPKTPQPITE